jgi:RNA polymerase sigma factor (sigma-70 family)
MSEPAEADAVFAKYSRRLAELAERNMSSRLRRRVDAEDIAQSVLRTFFRRAELGEFQIDESTDLWKLLVKITINKVHNKARHHQADKRDMAREARDGMELVVSRDPSPEDAAALVDHLEQLLEGLPDAHREILLLLMQGYSRTETAQKTNVSRMTVHRVLDLLRSKLA